MEKSKANMYTQIVAGQEKPHYVILAPEYVCKAKQSSQELL